MKTSATQFQRGMWVFVAVVWLCASWAEGGVTRLQIYQGRDCWVYSPNTIDHLKTYWLVVGVHGYGGQGKNAASIASWVKENNCIVVGPSFPNQGYQYLQKGADQQLLEIYQTLAKKFKLHPKMFLHGFSGGAQFVSRFALKYPDKVIGCGAHSGGTWPTDHEFKSKANSVVFVTSCGLKDNAKMHPSVPYNRLNWAKRFEKQLKEADFLHKSSYWPGTGHGQAKKPAIALSRECYELVTTGLFPKQKTLILGKLLRIDSHIRANQFRQAIEAMKQVPLLFSPKSDTEKTNTTNTTNNTIIIANGWTDSAKAEQVIIKLRTRYLDEQLHPRIKRITQRIKSIKSRSKLSEAQLAQYDKWLNQLENISITAERTQLNNTELKNNEH